MSKTYDCIVLGVGGFGSSTLFHLAERGLKVLGIDRFGIAHDKGSSHGETRMIRKAYFEHPNYVPLLHRSYDEWRRLESISGKQLMHLCGLMSAGEEGSAAISGIRQAAREHNLPIEELDLNEARTRFPGMRFRDNMEVVFEADAGFVEVENCVSAYVEAARNLGAELALNEPVVSWQSHGNTVRVETQSKTYEAASLVITAGAWSSQVLRDLNLPLVVLRKPVFWHQINSPAYRVEEGQPGFFYVVSNQQGETSELYGFPSVDGRTLKAGEHTGGRSVDNPLTVERGVHRHDCSPIESFLSEFMPGIERTHQRHSVCMYTSTPDGHFIIDRHPDHPNMIIGAGFSGHGFKFASGLGAAFADMTTNGATTQPVGFLSLKRFGPGSNN